MTIDENVYSNLKSIYNQILWKWYLCDESQEILPWKYFYKNKWNSNHEKYKIQNFKWKTQLKNWILVWLSLGTLAVTKTKKGYDTILFKIKKVSKENDEQIQKG